MMNGSDQVWTTERLFVSVKGEHEISPSRKVYCWSLSDAVEQSFGNVALPRIDRLLPSGSALQLSDVGFMSTRATWPNAMPLSR